MVEQLSSHPPRDTFNVVTWNILLDKTRSKLEAVDPQYVAPQAKRVEGHAKALMDLGMSLDVVMLQEVESENGDRIAELTGHGSGTWGQYNRQSEHIGAFGALVEEPEFYEIGENRKVVIVRIGDLAICGLHFSARPKRWRKRIAEAKDFCEIIEGEEKLVAVGDFNGIKLEPARILLARQGFKSAFAGVARRERMIYPTEEYRDIMWAPRRQRALPFGAGIDDILVKGDIEVVGTRTFVGPADHPGGVATIRL